jgi:N12 class adenine-specific DNA methylase/O-acetyl-ADP-ribose deacetylase (regulator of RNase III)/SAM-dependent methyltransferase
MSLASGRASRVEQPRNQNNYRISEKDEVGKGSLRKKCWHNLQAIRVVKQLESERRQATSEEKSKLVRYVGWGGLPQIFSPATDWQAENAELASLLSDDEFRAARATTLNAHYTSGEVIHAMYSALEHLGFRGGRILEPACGIGNFVGFMPDAIHSRSVVTGIEIDPLTAKIAKVLYPDADIRNEPFEKANLADEFFDVAVSNIPFGDYKPYDPKFNKQGFLIHDYFFAAALQKVRPGGLVMFVTSMGTMDKNNATLRKYLKERADLIGAIRLPNNTFKQNANTEVTTDIVILKKRRVRETTKGEKWEKVVPYTSTGGEVIPINEYYFNQPQMMLGEMQLKGRMYSRNEPTLVGNGKEIKEALAEAVKRLPQGIYESLNRSLELTPAQQTILAPNHVKPNAYTIHDDEIAVRRHEKLIPLPHLPIQTKLRIRGMIHVRDAVRECLRTQLEDAPDDDIQLARAFLNQAYDRFVSRFGPVSDRVNANAFEGDPDLPLLFSLENYDAEKRKAAKTAIFRERTIHKQKPVTSVNSAKEAVLVSLNEKGRVELKHMEKLLSRPAEDFLPELKGVLFLNPQTHEWETEDHYLSGDVREKLKTAEAASLTEPRFRENVEALKSVQPEDLPATEIDARLGACWIPVKDFEAFAKELLGADDATVHYIVQIGTWTVQGGWQAKSSVANTTEWGTNRASALELIEDALNLKTPTIYDKIRVGGKDKSVVNADATEAAREKQQKIKDRFREWIWQDDERRERLVKKYNEEFNSTRLRVFSGDHLTLPGASQIIRLHRHQKAGAWRILQTSNTLLGHVVGAGKTYTMVAAAMELKRLGLARKPMISVPNHMLGQFSSELLTLYPSANILAATKEDFEMSKRRELMSRIATGNWDAIIVTHSGFEKIPMSEKSKHEFFQTQIDELVAAIQEGKQEQHDRRIVKRLESAKKKLETKLKLLAADEKKDTTITFEELGVDRLFVDEAHYFKNLFYISKMTRVAGMPQTSSERAFDMFLKVQYIQKVNNGGGVVFATGTPIANSVAEMFTMQRYLQMGTLRKQQLQHFDSWAATFGEPVTAMELAPDGAGYRLNTRFARFINVPELMQMFCQAADIQTAEMLKLPVPEILTGKPVVIRAPSTPELKKVVNGLVQRAEAIRGGHVPPEQDNMLKITTEGRKAALDLRVLNPRAKDHPDSKINQAADKIFQIWKETEKEQSTQLVFCDLSTPSPNNRQFCAYDDLKAKLVRHGVPAEQIAFIQDYDSDVQKHVLFKEVQSGKIRILFGSTQKMGTGTNVQERLIALHHIDAPWRPADVEQREGRILRQGNRNKTVQIYRYVTEASFDAYMWQTLETKAKFIHQVMSGDTHIRHIEDIDSRALTYAEVKAIASGNPLVIEKASVDAEITRLTRLRSQHAETQFRIRSELRRSKEALPVIGQRIENIKLDIARRIDTRGDAFQIELEKQVVKDRGIAGELLNRIARRVAGSTNSHVIGSFAGFQVLARPAVLQPTDIVLKGHNYYTAHVSETALGTIRSLEHAAQNLEERLAYHQRELADTEKKSGELEAKIGQAFEHEGKLESLCTRQKELEEALDITKNQASNSLAAEETELQAEKETETNRNEIMNITYRIGDATQPSGDGSKIIVHVCNDLGGWGKGFVVALSGRWDKPEKRYRAWHSGKESQPFTLGEVQFVQVEDTTWVANLIGQHGMGVRHGVPPVRYDAIRDGLRLVATRAKELGASVHMPRIGCGLAGGKWEEVERIIREELTAQDVAVTVYDLPQRQAIEGTSQKP